MGVIEPLCSCNVYLHYFRGYLYLCCNFCVIVVLLTIMVYLIVLVLTVVEDGNISIIPILLAVIPLTISRVTHCALVFIWL